MAELDRAKLAAARLAAASRFPYLASALFGLTVVGRPGIDTVATDERWRLYIDPAVLDEATVEGLAGRLVHHVGHLLREHVARGRAAAGDRSGGAPDWQRAADAEIDDDLVDIGLVAADSPTLPGTFGAEDGRLAEEYYGLLVGAGAGGDDDPGTDGPPAPGSGGAATGEGGAAGEGGDGGASNSEGARGEEGRGEQGTGHDEHRHDPLDDCGSGAHGAPREWEVAGPTSAADEIPGLGEEAAALLRASVAQATRAHAKANPGSVPAGWLRWADELLEPLVDWRRALAAEVRRGVHAVAGRVDYSYRRPSRRPSPGGRVVLPSLHRPVPDVAVVCDTSGSMGPADLQRVLAEVEGILRGVGLRSGQVRVLSVDAIVHGGAQRVATARQVQLQGGGGTDMGVGIAAAAALRPRPKLVVVLTDGMTPWPAGPPPGIAVVVGVLHHGGGAGGGHGAPPAPAWARAVPIDLSA